MSSPIPNRSAPLPSGSDLNIGSYLLKDAFDARGRLLLAAGDRIEDKKELLRLTSPDVDFKPTKNHSTPINALAAVAQANIAEPPTIVDGVHFIQRVQRSAIVKAQVVRLLGTVFNRVEMGRKIDHASVRQMLLPLLIDLLQDPYPMLSLVLAKDRENYTLSHSVNVCILATALALHAGLTKFVEDVSIGGLLHDIGKAGIPKDIMHKSGPLNEAEITVMKQHPRIGAAVLGNSGDMSEVVVSCALDHHENMLGTGYPRAKRAESIGLFGMITAIADVYDTLTAERPYRKSLKPREALTVMVQQMGTSLEPHLLKTFVSLVGYFPPGLKIELANGYKAMVLRHDPADPTRPVLVQLLSDPLGLPVAGQPVLNLKAQRQNPPQDRPQVNLEPKSQPQQAPPAEVTKVVMQEIHGFHAFA